MNLICKLFGHKWRDTSHWEFKRENGKKLKRKILQVNCDRCNTTNGAIKEPWQADELHGGMGNTYRVEKLFNPTWLNETPILNPTHYDRKMLENAGTKFISRRVKP